MSAVYVEIPLERFPDHVLKELRRQSLQEGIELAELIARKALEAAEKVASKPRKKVVA